MQLSKTAQSILQNIARPSSFSGQYADPRWKARAKEFRQTQVLRCNSCRRNDVPIHVHHINYRFDAPIWEAPDCDLVLLCKNCHERTGEAIKAMRTVLSRMNSSNAMGLCVAIEASLKRHGETWLITQLCNADAR